MFVAVSEGNISQDLVPQRRASAKLLLVLLSDGYSQDYWKQLVSTATQVAHLPNTAVFAATVSRDFSRSELVVGQFGVHNISRRGQATSTASSARDVIGNL